MKKIFTMLMFILLSATQVCAQKAQLIEVSFGESPFLPTPGNCVTSKARITKLNTVSGEKGYWIERTYTTQDGKKFHAVCIDRAGSVDWNTKKVTGTTHDGVWGNGAMFKSLNILGFDANLEQHPQLGLSITIKLQHSVLIIENNDIKSTEEDLIAFASALLRTIMEL